MNYQSYIAGMRLVIPLKAPVSPCVLGGEDLFLEVELTPEWSDLGYPATSNSYQRCTMAVKTHVILLKILNNVCHVVSHCFSKLSWSCLKPKERKKNRGCLFLRFIVQGKGINRCTVWVEMLSLFNGMHRADIMSEIVSGRKPFLSAPYIPLLEMK